MTRPTHHFTPRAGSTGSGTAPPVAPASDPHPTTPMRSGVARRRLLACNELRDEIETWVNEGGAGDDVSR